MSYYLFRLDDIAPTMDMERFNACLALLGSAGAVPIVGIVPDNTDPLLKKAPPSPFFWESMRALARENKITVAQHGLHHTYHREKRSLLRKYGFGGQSEFAGLPFERQLEAVIRGREILTRHGLEPVLWMAPNHSFDRNTLKALSASGFSYVTDGVGFYPYRKAGLIFFPVLSGKPRRIPCGLTTICLHPNTMTDEDFGRLRSFLEKSPRLLSFEEACRLRRPPYAGLANGFCRIAFFMLKLVIRLRPGGRRQSHENKRDTGASA